MIRVRQVLPCLAAAVLSVGCSNDPAPPDDNIAVLPDFVTGLEAAARNFDVDPYEIGREWYDYDGNIHVVAPEPWVYALTRGESTWVVDVKSYYDDRGESGIFELDVSTLGDGEWSAPETVTLGQNVKEGPACLTLDPLSEVECSAPHDLVFRTAWRAIPEAGFSVQEPAIYVGTHFTLDEEPLVVRIMEVDEINKVPANMTEIEKVDIRPSAAAEPLHARVGWVHDDAMEPARQDTQIHITSNLQVAQWRIDALETTEDAIVLSFSARCQNALIDEQEPFPDEATTFDVSVPAQSSYSGRFVRICDAENAGVVAGDSLDDFTEPPLGIWPDAKSFDLMIEQVDGRVAIRLAPGHLLWNWTRGTETDPSAPFDPVDFDTVWDTYLQ